MTDDRKWFFNSHNVQQVLKRKKRIKMVKAQNISCRSGRFK